MDRYSGQSSGQQKIGIQVSASTFEKSSIISNVDTGYWVPQLPQALQWLWSNFGQP